MSSRDDLSALFSSRILEAIQASIIVIDEAQKIRYCNAAAEWLFGFERDELIGQPITNLMPMRYRRSHPTKVRRFQKGYEATRDMSDRPSILGLRSNGEEFPLSISIAKLNWNNQRWSISVIRACSSSIEEKAMSAMKAQQSRLQTETENLLSEIMLLRGKDEQTEEKISELTNKISQATQPKGSFVDWIKKLSLWQRIVAMLVSAILMISNGVSVPLVLEDLLEQIGEIEVGD